MSYFKLILRDLWFYRKPYLSVLSGVALSIAVLTGALIVGDSVKGSLESLTEIRMGRARFAVQSHQHFFRRQLANDLSEAIHSQVMSVMQSQGMAVNNDKGVQLNRVEVVGIDDRFSDLWNNPGVRLGDGEALVSKNTAARLNLKPGDAFLLKAEKMGSAPRNAPFVSDKNTVVTLDLKVAGIADDNKMGRFSLASNQSAPYLVFVNIEMLSKAQDLEGSANLLLIPDDNNQLTTDVIQAGLRRSWKLEDAGLKVEQLSGKNNYEIKSGRIFLNPIEVSAARHSIPGARFYLTYLINAISTKGHSTPYSFVTATDSGEYRKDLQANGVIINEWLANDLQARMGDSVSMKYYIMGALHSLREDSAHFIIRRVIPMKNIAWDSTLMPEFPGMSNAGSCREWDAGTPIDMDKIRTKDEQYWNQYRGTPKAILALDRGQELWHNPFGNCTSIRFTSDKKQLQVILNTFLQKLDPQQSDLIVQDIYKQGKTAAQNSVDFGGLFLSLSFYIIIAALLLTGLLFGLLTKARISEAGILGAVGFRQKRITQIFLAEALIVAILGGLIGVLAGLVYNRLMIVGLNSLWQDAVRTNLLEVHVRVSSVLTGFFAGIILCVLSMLIVILRFLKKPLAGYIKGSQVGAIHINYKSQTISLVVFVLSLLFSGILIIMGVLNILQDQSVVFLSAGGGILISGLAFVNYILIRSQNVKQKHVLSFSRLVIKNTSLKQAQTMAAIALLAIGCFSIIITGTNKRSFYGSENETHSGTGGFIYWTETSIPVLYNLNSGFGRKEFNLDEEPLLKDVKFVQLSVLEGDDASCLNLNQVQQPSILGVNAHYFDQKNSFSMEKAGKQIDPEHPWRALNKELSDGVIPAYADQSVIQWGLQKKLGDTLIYKDEQGKTLKVVLLAGLANSIFQGNILISDTLFRKYFPSASGSKIMLIDSPGRQNKQLANTLESVFIDYGIRVTPTAERLATFNSVTNTYLSVFMLLGGLGILIGTIGLGIVLQRNIRERKAEIAIYLAIGYKWKLIFRVVVAEYVFVLLAGMSIGTISAMFGCLPSLLNPTIQKPWLLLGGILVIILLNGLLWIIVPVMSLLKKNLVQSLRKE